MSEGIPMKPKSARPATPPRVQREEARVAFALLAKGVLQNSFLSDRKSQIDGERRDLYAPHEDAQTVPVLVLPFPTASAAKRRLKFERLSQEDKMKAIADAYDKEFKQWIDSDMSGTLNIASAVLHLLEGEK